MIVLQIIGAYFGAGLLVLAIFEIATRRISTRLSTASFEAHQKLLDSGNYVGITMAKAALIFAMWIFWPALLYGAIKGK